MGSPRGPRPINGREPLFEFPLLNEFIDRRLTPKLEAAIARVWGDGAIWNFDQRLGLTLISDAYSEVRRDRVDP